MVNKERAAASAKVTAHTQTKLSKVYHNLPSDTKEKAVKGIANLRSDIPSVYAGVYSRAVSGKSLRSAVNSFCLQCMGWQREEVRFCCSYACPLWSYRPYQIKDASFSENTRESGDFVAESTNAKDTQSKRQILSFDSSDKIPGSAKKSAAQFILSEEDHTNED
jgi:hypothetical protein